MTKRITTINGLVGEEIQAVKEHESMLALHFKSGNHVILHSDSGWRGEDPTIDVWDESSPGDYELVNLGLMDRDKYDSNQAEIKKLAEDRRVRGEYERYLALKSQFEETK